MSPQLMALPAQAPSATSGVPASPLPYDTRPVMEAALFVLAAGAGKGIDPEVVLRCGTEHRVVGAPTLMEANRFLGRHADVVAIALVSFEDGDGEALRLSRRLRREHPHILPVVVVAPGNREQIRRAYADGAEMVMQRPSGCGDLVTALLAMRHQADERSRQAREESRERTRPLAARSLRRLRSALAIQPGSWPHRLFQAAALTLLLALLSAGVISALDTAASAFGQNVRRVCAFMDNVEGHLARDEARELQCQSTGR
ncbi:MAG: hypothetical protein HYY93_03535 [Planctomycetes bacterium]|nr:hypothetical protein [Planctomycetota bacterium]